MTIMMVRIDKTQVQGQVHSNLTCRIVVGTAGGAGAGEGVSGTAGEGTEL